LLCGVIVVYQDMSF